jgi:hypothetical protein
MGALAVFLIAVGVADICRKLTHRLWPALIAGAASVVISAAAGGLWHRGDIALLVLACTVTVTWIMLGGNTERSGTRHGRALATFGFGGGLIIAFSGWSSESCCYSWQPRTSWCV